jgi:hypothetical protein
VGIVVVLVLLVAVAAIAFAWWRRKQLQDAYRTLLARDGLHPTARPCGLGEGNLRLLRSFPQGDRRYGLEYGAAGPRAVTIEGVSRDLECAAFVWWWEERRTSQDANGHTTTHYDRKDRVVGAIRLPRAMPSVSIVPEGLFTRWGLGGRGDFQVESDEFNRRFDVCVSGDQTLAIRLFDARFQRFLLEMFDGRSIELVGDVLLVAGDPPGEDGDLYGDIGELPGARRDAALLASRIPASFWRGLTAGGGA